MPIGSNTQKRKKKYRFSINVVYAPVQALYGKDNLDARVIQFWFCPTNRIFYVSSRKINETGPKNYKEASYLYEVT